MSPTNVICASLWIIFTIKTDLVISTDPAGPAFKYYVYIPIGIEHQISDQDNADAQAILDDKMSDKSFASILPYREKIRRMSIIIAVDIKSGDNPYLDERYFPLRQENPPFKDLVFGLVEDENNVLGGYLDNFFANVNYNYITIGMVLTKDMLQLIHTYETDHFPYSFKDLRKNTKSPYENMLRVMVRQNREKIEEGTLNQSLIEQDSKALIKEYDDGGWHENRNKIEEILMKRSVRYARAVIIQFENENGQLLSNLINDCIKNHDLNEHLADMYSSLVRYIKDKHQYTADLMRQYCDGKDHWAVWIMCIAVTSPEEWPLVDKAFQKGHTDGPLSKFIMQKLTDNKIMAETFAAIIDPSFKPTTFVKKPIQ